MPRSSPRLPGPHQLVGWERQVWRQLACLVALGACALPILAGALAREPWPVLSRLPAWFGSRSARELSGFTAGAIALFQLSWSLQKRVFGARSGVLHRLRTAHQLAPIALSGLALLHTRGHPGANLNRWLIGVLLLQIMLVQAGHVAKAWFAERAAQGAFAELDRIANTRAGWMHRIGLHAHVLLATAFALLLLVHVAAVYYF